MKQLPVHILGIAPYDGMHAAMERSAESYPNIHLDVFTGDLEAGVAIVREHLGDAYDCILSRGGTAQMIRKVTDIPVVEIPLSVYDVMRTIRLAQNYADRYAIVGFPGIAEPAHTLCDLLRYNIDIITIQEPQELHPTLLKLQQEGYRMVIGDMATHTQAQKLGMNAFLITSGAESLHTALAQAQAVGASFRQLRLENLFYRKLMQEQSEAVAVLDEGGGLNFAQPAPPSPELLKRFQEKIPEIPAHNALRFYNNQSGRLYRITAQTVTMGSAKYYLYHYSTTQIPLRSGKSGLRSFSQSECAHLFNTSFYNLSGALGEMETTINSIAATTQPVMIVGEAGTGKEQIARLLYLRSHLSSKPFVVIDCTLAGDKTWDFLINHHASPLNDLGNTIYFQNFDAIQQQHGQELLALILSTDLASRERLIFSCTCPGIQALPQTAARLMQLLTCIPLLLPTLRSRSDEIPSLASLYLGSLNLELGKQISGFDARAMEQLRQFPWPDNYTQFKRVIQELAAVTTGYYIRSATVAELLSREHSTLPNHSPSPGQGRTLDEIIRSAITQALAENGGNQTAAAKQLGIGRSTLWRHMNSGE